MIWALERQTRFTIEGILVCVESPSSRTYIGESLLPTPKGSYIPGLYVDRIPVHHIVNHPRDITAPLDPTGYVAFSLRLNSILVTTHHCLMQYKSAYETVAQRVVNGVWVETSVFHQRGEVPEGT